MPTPRWLDTVGRTLKTNSPAILSGISVAGVIGTAILAVQATPKAMLELSDAKTSKYSEEETATWGEAKLTPREVVAVSWRFYIPAGISAAATIACVIGANSIGARRQAAVAGAYTLVDQSFREYKNRVLEELTPNKNQKIADDANKECLHRNPIGDREVIVTGTGEQLCMDAITGRYFKSDIEAIRRAENNINQRVLTDMYASQNDFYELLGLGPTTIGSELGWNIDNLLEVHFSSLLNELNHPCLVVGYKRLPHREFWKV